MSQKRLGGISSKSIKAARKGSIKYLHNAKTAKNDDFYTILCEGTSHLLPSSFTFPVFAIS